MKKNLLLLLFVALGLFTLNSTSAQISLTAIDVAYTQNFDFFGDAHVYFSDNDPNFPGFYSFRTVTNAQPQELRRSTLGVSTSNLGRFYNSGNSTDPSERALVLAYSSASGILTAGLLFVNNTGSTITSLDVSYTGEQWRVGGSAGPPISIIPNTLDFEYYQAASISDVISDTYIPYPSLSFTSPNVSEASLQTAIDGNLPENQTYISSTITVNIPVGEQIMLRWIDQTDDPGFDHQLGIDNLSVTPRSLISGTSNLSEEKSGLFVYPNPVEDFINLDMSNIVPASIEVFDMTGRCVISKTIDEKVSAMNVATLPKGLYMVKVKGAGGTVTSKFLKK